MKTNQLILLEARKNLYEWLLFIRKFEHDLKNIHYLQAYSITNKIVLYLHAIYSYNLLFLHMVFKRIKVTDDPEIMKSSVFFEYL